jgi:hypothetical protein
MFQHSPWHVLLLALQLQTLRCNTAPVKRLQKSGWQGHAWCCTPMYFLLLCAGLSGNNVTAHRLTPGLQPVLITQSRVFAVIAFRNSPAGCAKLQLIE